MNSPLRSLAQEYTQPLRLVIVEDNLDHYTILKRIVSKQFPHLSIVGHCESVQELRTHIANEKPDILLLDIQIRGGCALEALAEIPAPCFDFIVISAQRNFVYAQKAMRLGASHYFTKPYSPEDLFEALHKVIAKRMGAAQAAVELSLLKQQVHEKTTVPVPAPNADEVLYLQDGRHKITVPIVNVCCVEADKHYVVVHTLEGKCYRHRAKFREFLQHLREHGFVQTHKSYGVALRHIEKLVPEFAVLRWEGKHEKKIPIARGYAPDVKKAWLAFHVH